MNIGDELLTFVNDRAVLTAPVMNYGTNDVTQCQALTKLLTRKNREIPGKGIGVDLFDELKPNAHVTLSLSSHFSQQTCQLLSVPWVKDS